MPDEDDADDGALYRLWDAGVTDDDIAAAVALADELAAAMNVWRSTHRPGDRYPVLLVARAIALADGPLHLTHLPIVQELMS